MDLLTKNDLRALIEKPKGSNGLCISIFMPTHRMWPETQQDPIRLKNLLRIAEEDLIQNGLRSPDAKKLLEPSQVFLIDTSFWRYQGDGLAIFLSSGVFQYYRLPLKFGEFTVVTHRFNIKPLLPLFNSDGHFFVLALSQNKIRLFQSTRYSISEMDLEKAHVPTSISEALRYTEFEKQPQFRTRMTPFTGGSASMGGKAGTFYSSREDIDEARKNILEYFNRVDKGLHELLHDEKAPLVLAGVEYLLPIYRETNSYPYLMERGITGSPKEINEKELHEQAWTIVQPYFQKEQEDAVRKYKQFADTDRTSHDIKEIVVAAYHGRVESLFVAVGIRQWGTFNLETHVVHAHEKEEVGDEDLLDLAAIHTFLKGGFVYAVEPEKVPDTSLSAAVFRY
ncbi:MAG: hypothetical protein JETT_1674 [Candidatus Jettenia ecosi]|uniref:Uncharacterized protein n=1 Tax=Candidatus Jettenia ecosi TaxID=2494326 RepID=A0A533QBI9_9BACT|nr:MAG: hypothetical protein JETT_1674 [Candidatus Jettenia ecosi]